jgi:uncharacterized protein YidB (DUF937 family)
MKKWTGKVLATTVAAVVVIGGFGGLSTHQAFADDDSSSSDSDTAVVVQAPNTSIPLEQRVNLELNTIVSKASAVLDLDTSDLAEQLRGGKSLTEITQASGYNRSEVINQLIQMLDQNVDNALNQQAITNAEAAALRTKIANEVQKAFDKAGYEDTAAAVNASFQEPAVRLSYSEKSDALASVIGISKDELDKAVIEDNKSIADIAAAKGISEDQLLATLKDALTSTLKDFIHQK